MPDLDYTATVFLYLEEVIRNLEEIKIILQNEIHEQHSNVKCEYTVIIENEYDSRDQRTYYLSAFTAYRCVCKIPTWALCIPSKLWIFSNLPVTNRTGNAKLYRLQDLNFVNTALSLCSTNFCRKFPNLLCGVFVLIY